MTTVIEKPKSKAQVAREEMEAAQNRLRKLFETDQTVYTRLLSVSRSGMHRVISLHVARDNRIENITWYVAKATGRKMKEVHGSRGIGVDGCGMDMGFHIVYGLSCRLYCSDKYEHEAAYRLKHEWM